MSPEFQFSIYANTAVPICWSNHFVHVPEYQDPMGGRLWCPSVFTNSATKDALCMTAGHMLCLAVGHRRGAESVYFSCSAGISQAALGTGPSVVRDSAWGNQIIRGGDRAVEWILIIRKGCACQSIYFLRFICNSEINVCHVSVVVHGPMQSSRNFESLGCTFRDEVEQGHAWLSHSSAPLANKCPFHGLFNATELCADDFAASFEKSRPVSPSTEGCDVPDGETTWVPRALFRPVR